MERLQKLISLVRPYYSSNDPAHDWPHIGRVVANAKLIMQEVSVNQECVLAAIYCHDLVNIPKDHPERSKASTLSMNEARPILESAGFNPDEIAIIAKGILEHSFSKGLQPTCIEAAVVQDADRLDAVGAIGILRCAAVNTQMKSSFYDPFDPTAKMREFDDKSFMLDHYFVKLFELSERMNTSIAKKIAAERIEFMKLFLEQLLGEIKCG